MYVRTFGGLGQIGVPSLPIGKFGKTAKSPAESVKDIATKIAQDGIKEGKSYDAILKSAGDAAWAYILEIQIKQQASVTTRTLIQPVMSRKDCDLIVKQVVVSATFVTGGLVVPKPPAEQPPLTTEVLPMTVETAAMGGMGVLVLGGLAVTAFIAYMIFKK